MSTRLSLREALERQAPAQDADPGPSGFRVDVVLAFVAGTDRPVDVARALIAGGLSLRKAHDVLNRLAAGARVPVSLTGEGAENAIVALAALGVSAAPVRVPAVDPRAIREGLALSQSEFAIRFGINLDTIRNWEQRRSTPDAAARLLLHLIETQTEMVDDALRDGAPAPARPR